MNKILIITAILIAFAAGNLKASDEVTFVNGTYAEVLAKAKQENKVLMIDFITDWCKWCIETDKKVYTQKDVYEYANTYQVNWKIDAEKGEGPELAKKYNVQGYPTIVFVNGDGVEIDRIYGYIFADDFLQKMKDYGQGINTYTSLKEAQKNNPEDPAANYKLADKMMSNGMKGYDEYIAKVIKLDPENTYGYTDDALYAMSTSVNEAEEYRKFMQKYPESNKYKDAWISLASALAKDDFAAGKKEYADAFARYGADDRDLSFNYGMFLMGRGAELAGKEQASPDDYAEAIKVLDEAIPYLKGSVNEASANYYYSSIYLSLNELEKAMSHIDTAIMLYDKKVYREMKDKINQKITGSGK